MMNFMCQIPTLIPHVQKKYNNMAKSASISISNHYVSNLMKNFISHLRSTVSWVNYQIHKRGNSFKSSSCHYRINNPLNKTKHKKSSIADPSHLHLQCHNNFLDIFFFLSFMTQDVNFFTHNWIRIKFSHRYNDLIRVISFRTLYRIILLRVISTDCYGLFFITFLCHDDDEIFLWHNFYSFGKLK